MKILMVCLGNICRSPLAEGILQQKANAAGLQWKIDSAGTNGYHVGEAPHHLSQKVARKNGVDISSQLARKFSADDFEKFDKIYVMAADVLHDVKQISGHAFKPEKISFFLDAMYPGENRDVPDPWYGDDDGYDEVYEMINATCTKMIEQFLHTQQTQKA